MAVLLPWMQRRGCHAALHKAWCSREVSEPGLFWEEYGRLPVPLHHGWLAEVDLAKFDGVHLVLCCVGTPTSLILFLQ